MIKELLFHPKLCLDCHEEWTKSKGLCKDCLEKIEYVYGRNRILSDEPVSAWRNVWKISYWCSLAVA